MTMMMVGPLESNTSSNKTINGFLNEIDYFASRETPWVLVCVIVNIDSGNKESYILSIYCCV